MWSARPESLVLSPRFKSCRLSKKCLTLLQRTNPETFSQPIWKCAYASSTSSSLKAHLVAVIMLLHQVPPIRDSGVVGITQRPLQWFCSPHSGPSNKPEYFAHWVFVRVFSIKPKEQVQKHAQGDLTDRCPGLNKVRSSGSRRNVREAGKTNGKLLADILAEKLAQLR